MESASAVTRLAALAQESRLAIFRLLVAQGPAGLCAGDIGSRLQIAPATLSFHLKELSHAGLLQARQDGRYIYYAADFAAIDALMAYLSDNCCGGAPCAVSRKPTSKRKPA